MNKVIFASIYTIFAFCNYANAEIHTWVDKNGTVHFSDSQSADKSVKSKIIDVKESNVVESNISGNNYNSYSDQQQNIPKPVINITQPSEQLIRSNEGNVSILGNVSNASGLTSSTLYVDGVEQQTIYGTGTLSASFSNMDRGEHTISIVSKYNNSTVASSEKKFTLLRAHK